ncbi:transporter [Bacteroidales bacterium]|nr:transporter [Bacteroidales bacterium]
MMEQNNITNIINIMKHIIFIIILSGLVSLAKAQENIDLVLQDISTNNSQLEALQKEVNAQKIGNKTGIHLSNPELGINYLWGSPSEMGNRKDISLMQGFDFPTAYRYKSQMANERNKLSDLQFAILRKEILLRARLICVDIVYRNKLKSEFSKRFAHATQMAEAYQTRFDKGDTDILERNKTQLNLLNTKKILELNEIELITLKDQLQQLNGGIELRHQINDYPIVMLPSNFEEWYKAIEEENPVIEFGKQEVALSGKQEKLSRSMNLPKFSMGYMSERIAGTTHQGIGFGISIPLWENKNTLKHAKAQTIALQSAHNDTQFMFESALKNQFAKAKYLSDMLKDYKTLLEATNSEELLSIALNKGHVSLINYLLELSINYEVTDKYIDSEKDYHIVLSELRQWE